MVDRYKLAYIGAGSFRFSLGLFMNIVNAKELLPMEVALCDIDAQSLEVMAKILRRMAKKAANKLHFDLSQLQISTSTDQKVVLENADGVIKSISVGMQKSEWFDIYLPLKFGIPQNTGDTIGPGGLFRALRTDPICASIAKDMKKLCPKAPLLNYTNPNSSCTLAARTVAPEIQFIGLCHELFGGMKVLRRFYNKYLHKHIPRWQEMDIEYTGVNHFAWITKICYKGEDLYPDLRHFAHQLVLDKFHNPDAANGFNFHLLENYGVFPYPGARHVAEFMPDYYNAFNHKKVNQCPYWSFPEIRSVSNVNRERHLAYFGFRLWANGRLPTLGPRKEGELALEMLLDCVRNQPTEYVVNIPNTGIIPKLPSNCIVEVPGFFKDKQMVPKSTIHISDELRSLLLPHCEQQPMTVAAALGNNYDLVLKAMQHDPMCAWIEDPEKIEFLTKLMLFYEQEWLPAPWKDWIPTENELKASKYWLSPQDLAKTQNRYLEIRYLPSQDLQRKAFFWK